MESCTRPARSLELCNPHYLRLRRDGDVQAGVPIYEGTGAAPKRSAVLVSDRGTKPCSRCGEDLPVSEFGPAKTASGLSGRCRPCARKADTERRKADPVAAAERSRWAYIKTRFRLSKSDYTAMLASQGGVCEICRCSPDVEPLRVDHDHACCSTYQTCGRCVRGLLCSKCNWLLGIASDDPERLTAAAEYLRKRTSWL